MLICICNVLPCLLVLLVEKTAHMNLNSCIPAGVALPNRNNNVLRHAAKLTDNWEVALAQFLIKSYQISLGAAETYLWIKLLIVLRWKLPRWREKKVHKNFSISCQTAQIVAVTEALLCLYRAAQGGCMRECYKGLGVCSPAHFPPLLSLLGNSSCGTDSAAWVFPAVAWWGSWWQKESIFLSLPPHLHDITAIL